MYVCMYVLHITSTYTLDLSVFLTRNPELERKLLETKFLSLDVNKPKTTLNAFFVAFLLSILPSYFSKCTKPALRTELSCVLKAAKRETTALTVQQPFSVLKCC